MSWSSEMHSGTVRNWFDSNQAKGYGFIIPDIEGDDGDDVFVHRQNLANAPYLNLVPYKRRTSSKPSMFGC